MKKLFYFLVLFIVATGCEKNDPVMPANPTTKMTFAVTGLTYQVKGLSQKSISAVNQPSVSDTTEKIRELAFILYDLDGNELKRKIQYAEDAEFGAWSTDVPANSNVIIAVVGSTGEFNINSAAAPGSGNVQLSNFKDARMAYVQPYPELSERIYTNACTYYKAVTTHTSESNISLSLDRIVGKMEFDIKDTDKYSVQIIRDATEFLFFDEQGTGASDDEGGMQPVQYAGTPLSFYVLKTHEPVLVRIIYTDGNGDQQEKMLEVPVFKNKKTVVSGNLLAVPSTSSLSVTFNDQWDEDAAPVSF